MRRLVADHPPCRQPAPRAGHPGHRLEPGWLEAAYIGDPPRLAALAGSKRHLRDIGLRYRTTLARLGPALDHGGSLTGADAWYFILEGTREHR